jgi:hypothetical protein
MADTPTNADLLQNFKTHPGKVVTYLQPKGLRLFQSGTMVNNWVLTLP